MKSLYQEIILDHYRNPRNKGVLEKPDFVCNQHNPSCGDSVSWQGKLYQGRVIAVVFEGYGCVISQATASLLSEYVINKTIAEVMELDNQAILSLIGITLGPTRLKCALLSLEALQEGIGR